ncbi:hypothetical protein RCL_jg9281.t1 [Rhizophagus clarus]|uniref:Uncharacterized protein n=1 Tax=Rhizophagus clarus TaxID=94130 RepID=A0A8H3M7H8_9GLOM|nr:hypothetical protein RCL_jg9281.t1 [Rhizophagus clarus]
MNTIINMKVNLLPKKISLKVFDDNDDDNDDDESLHRYYFKRLFKKVEEFERKFRGIAIIEQEPENIRKVNFTYT